MSRSAAPKALSNTPLFPQHMNHAWKDTFAVLDNEGILRIGNSQFQRKYQLANGLLHTLELKNASGSVLARECQCCSDMECYGSNATLDKLECGLDFVHFQVIEDDRFDAPHALVTVQFTESCSQMRMQREFYLYPNLPAYSFRNRIESPVLPRFNFTSRKRLGRDYERFFEIERQRGLFSGEPRRNEPVMDAFHPAPGYAIAGTVEFLAHTDVHDTPVIEHPAEGTELLGNLLFCENERHSGFLILQEAPASSERSEREEYDFRINGNGDVLSLCWGILPEEIPCGKELLSYRNTVAFYSSAAEREMVLKRYIKMRMEATSPRYAIVANAWGCGHFPKSLSPSFLQSEIKAAKECGAEIYQIDDGWQQGRSLYELQGKNTHRPLSEFWAVSREKVGEAGFQGLAEAARAAGIELALWLAPSSNIAYRDHSDFSRMLLDFHRQFGFRLFKLDDASLLTYEARQNFEQLLKETREASDMDILFNLDVTANARGGYFMFSEYGNLFLENRYACHAWGMGYHPERTLRNLWCLSRYVRPQLLQIEVPAYRDANQESHKMRGEVPAQSYPWDYWGAIALFANPLLWFAPSTIPQEERRTISTILELHKKYRASIFGGEISPIGEMPSGHALTGFLSRNENGSPRAAILLRELQSQRESLNLPDATWKCVAGKGYADGRQLAVTQTASWALFLAENQL